MKIVSIIFLGIVFLSISAAGYSYASKNLEEDYRKQCLQDLEFIRKRIAGNSAPYKDPSTQSFRDWFRKGYDHTKELINGIYDQDDCYYAMKFYLNGFNDPYVSLRGYIPLPTEKYPGLLTAKYGDQHIVVYKNPRMTHLHDIHTGDIATHINDLPIEQYFTEYTLPFYSNDSSEFSKRAASVYNFIVDGNRFAPVPLSATFITSKGNIRVDLKYAELAGDALTIARNIRQPDPDQHFKVEMVSSGVWITIPSFYLGRSEAVFYTGMLSKLKELGKEDYIVFDLRGNRGGAARWARPIIRNLWGDEYIRSLGKNHDYNNTWVKKVRVSKQNFFEFKKTANSADIKSFAASLSKGNDFYEKKWKIYSEDLNLYSNKDRSPFRAKIYVLTDSFCRSTCWSFVNELTQIPGVMHIGLPTAAQNSSSYAIRTRTPDGSYDFFYPTEIRVAPNRNLGKSLIPYKLFKGNIRNESEVTKWVLSITEGNG